MIDNDLMRVIAQVESGGRLDAVRFEPAVYQRVCAGYAAEAVTVCMVSVDCSHETAAVLVASSWGRYQLMGFNLWGLDYRRGLAELLTSAVLQDTLLERFLVSRHLDECSWARLVAEPAMRSWFVSRYNGPGAVEAYWGRMVACARGMGLVVPDAGEAVA